MNRTNNVAFLIWTISCSKSMPMKAISERESGVRLCIFTASEKCYLSLSFAARPLWTWDSLILNCWVSFRCLAQSRWEQEESFPFWRIVTITNRHFHDLSQQIVAKQKQSFLYILKPSKRLCPHFFITSSLHWKVSSNLSLKNMTVVSFLSSI